jgi:Flp pilus assembly protein TadD
MTGGDPATAAAEANRARHYVPWASEPWIVIADSDTRAGDLAGARTALREALDRNQNDWALWVRFAAVARGGERTVAVRRALALNPLLTAR